MTPRTDAAANVRAAIAAGQQEAHAVSKKTNKQKINARRKKANHGTKPNAGRG